MGRRGAIVGRGVFEGRGVRDGSCGDGPSGGRGAQPEHGEARQVGGGSEEVEVGVDLWSSTDACSSSAVAAAHEVAELAFDFGPVGAVVGLPGRVGLTLTGAPERGFEHADADGAAAGCVGAGAVRWAAGAVLSEVGNAVAVHAAPDRHGDVVGAGDGVGVEVHVEAVLAELAGRRGRRLGPTRRADVFVVQTLLEFTGPIGRVAVDLRVTALVSVGGESMRSSATDASPALPGVTIVLVMISLSGSDATWPL